MDVLQTVVIGALPLAGIAFGAGLQERSASRARDEAERSEWRRERARVYRDFLRWSRAVPIRYFQAAATEAPNEVFQHLNIGYSDLVSDVSVYATPEVLAVTASIGEALARAAKTMKDFMREAHARDPKEKLSPALFAETYGNALGSLPRDLAVAMRAEMMPPGIDDEEYRRRRRRV